MGTALRSGHLANSFSPRSPGHPPRTHADVHAGRGHAAAVVEVILDGGAGITWVRIGHVASSTRTARPREPALTTTAFTHFRDDRQTKLAELPLRGERRSSRSPPPPRPEKSPLGNKRLLPGWRRPAAPSRDNGRETFLGFSAKCFSRPFPEQLQNVMEGFLFSNLSHFPTSVITPAMHFDAIILKQ